MASQQTTELNQETAEIRPLTEIGEFQACVELQQKVWGYHDSDLVPARMFVIARSTGGQVFGAYFQGQLIGYALALVGARQGRAYLHSHMLAVDPQYRDMGLGRAMKWRQREDALARGFELMEWTFDPLEIKNSYLNLQRLGAIARRYLPNYYGPSQSALQAGLPTDRLVAEWWLHSRRVRKCLAGESEEFEIKERVPVPGEIYAWKQNRDPRAEKIQTENRKRLQAAFAQNLIALGYQRDQAGNGTFLLGQGNHPELMNEN